MTQPRSVAIVMLSALGDAVHVLPVANALRRAWPGVRITWILQPLAHRLVEGHDAIDEFIVFHRRRGIGALHSCLELRRALRHRHFDLLLALQVYFKAGVITGLAPATRKLGFDRARARDLNWLFTNRRIPARPLGHVQDAYFEFLEALGVDPEPVEWNIRLRESERAAQREFFAALDRPACAFVVATSKPAKNWPPELCAQVIDAVEQDFGLRALVVGGPSRSEREALDRIHALTRRPPIDALGDDVRRLVWLLGGSRLAISPDTGPLHLARALEVPVIGLYGYTNPLRYGPYMKFRELIVDGYARHPEEPYRADAGYRDDGMSRVTVSRVLEKVELALASSG
ncbi:MAG: glycosyltransferase family 9 protein [Gemmatimonadetes bacterium]|nr:glycosyltransferase family 9 protein [Gemmatimonadota bacterium]